MITDHMCCMCARYATLAVRVGAQARTWYCRDHVPEQILQDPATTHVRTMIRMIEDETAELLRQKIEVSLEAKLKTSATAGRPADVIGAIP